MTHPARFSDPVLDAIDRVLDEFGAPRRVLDPFAGIGRVHELRLNSIGVEREREWARQHPRNVCATVMALPFPRGSFDGMITSPTYGNRMADHHEARDGSYRVTYRHSLGRALASDNSGRLNWGPRYRTFHAIAWNAVAQYLTRDPLVIINISNHIRKGEEQDVMGFHRECWLGMGYRLREQVPVQTKRMGLGANRDTRVNAEYLMVFTA